MARLSDARVLYRIWASHFDPTQGDLGRAAASVQEAWLLVAAGARMLDTTPEPPALVIPGHLYMATWRELDSWKGDAPRRPKVAFLYPDEERLYVLDEERYHIPIIRRVPTPPDTIRRIPGMIYDETPIEE